MGPNFNSFSVKTPFIFARHGAFNNKGKKKSHCGAKSQKRKTTQTQKLTQNKQKKTPHTKNQPVCYLIKHQGAVFPQLPRLTLHHFPQQPFYSCYFICYNCSLISLLLHTIFHLPTIYTQEIFLYEDFA